jgi:hypothetical protein
MHQTMQWIMHKQLTFPDGIDGKTIDFISKLLNRDARQRLGCGLTGNYHMTTPTSVYCIDG